MPTSGLTVAQLRAEARQAAQAVLDVHWDGTLPVDPVKLARALGVSVFDAQLGDDTWGMIVGSDKGADIYLDRDQPHVRYRFSCAHELGHYVDHQSDLEPGTGFADKRSESGRGNPEEVFANEFGASVLMPEPYFREAAAVDDSSVALANMFQVSLMAAALRKHHLGIK